MVIKYFLWGMLIKIITGFDDSLTRIPILNYITKTKKGKVSFGIGIFLAMIFGVIVALLFSKLLIAIPNYNYFVAGFLIIVACIIYFEPLKNKEKEAAKKIEKNIISNKKVIKLIIYGFLISILTLIDDIFAYSVVFLNKEVNFLIPAAGILLAGLLQIFIVIYFSKKLNKLKFKKEISAIGLLAIAALVFFKIL